MAHGRYYGANSPYEHYTNLKTQKDLEWDIREAKKRKAKEKEKAERIAYMEANHPLFLDVVTYGLLAYIVISVIWVMIGG